MLLEVAGKIRLFAYLPDAVKIGLRSSPGDLCVAPLGIMSPGERSTNARIHTVKTIRTLLQDELDHLGESWRDIETLGVTEEMLEREVGELEHGDPVAWTRYHVITAATDGDWGDFLESAPRNPPLDFQPIQPLPLSSPTLDGPMAALSGEVAFAGLMESVPALPRKMVGIQDFTFHPEDWLAGDAA